jgi:dethiobiotin synthetase
VKYTQIYRGIIIGVGMRLGCLNHVLLSFEAIAARGFKLAGWVANFKEAVQPALKEDLATLEQRFSFPLLGVIPYKNKLTDVLNVALLA